MFKLYFSVYDKPRDMLRNFLKIGIQTPVSGHNTISNGENSTLIPNKKDGSNEVLGNTLEKDFIKGVMGEKDVINIAEYENIKRKELQDAKSLKYSNDIYKTYEIKILLCST